MVVDARSMDDGFFVEADLCIVGAGAAGLTIAGTLAGTKISICLLESGGFSPEEQTQDLYRGEYAGDVPTLDDDYLSQSRQRYFGGTTNHWAGMCRPLEPIDFEERDWVPHSGWPFPKSVLDPYYRRAAKFMRMSSFDVDNPDGLDPSFPATLDDDVFYGGVYRLRPLRFGEVYRDDVTGAANIRLIHHANAIEVVTSESGATITELEIATLSGRRGRVRARAYVLAAGAIENCRLLLASDRQQRQGVGNGRDLVGRYFMEHPVTHVGMGPMVVWPEVSVALYRWHDFRTQALYLHEDVSRTRKLLTMALLIAMNAVGPRVLNDFDKAVARSSFQIDHLGAQQAPPGKPDVLATVYMCEQAPNPDSRVTLTSERDALGMRRVRLRWLLSGTEIASIYRFAELIGTKVSCDGYGRLKNATAPQALSEVISKGYHHMGTTRMHVDPKRGVVDENARVHGIDNLYVAGSSVFPTSGAANPTFTIVALAIRMADHLKRRLGTA